MNGTVKAIYTSPTKGGEMQAQQHVLALQGLGLEGDRYASAAGSFNEGRQGKREVTLMNVRFFPGSEFEYADSRRNIFVKNVELMWLIGREFKIGHAVFRGVKYCDPCTRPNGLAGIRQSFKETFEDCGGLIAEVTQGGLIRTGDCVIPPPKEY